MTDNPYELPENSERPETRKSTESKRTSMAWPIVLLVVAPIASYLIYLLVALVWLQWLVKG